MHDEPMQEAVAADEPKAPKKSMDVEFAAIRKIGAVLATLSESAQRRVMQYHADRLLLDP